MGFKINSVKLNNYGQIQSFSCDSFTNVNLIIGENGTGKTFLLKALYSAVKSMEEYKRGDDIRSINEILAEKLRWTFQVDKLGDMVTKSSDGELSFELHSDDTSLSYKFTDSTVAKLVNAGAFGEIKRGNSVFIPAKEVLSLFSVILKSREVDKAFGFDETYYDLAKALRIAPSRGKNYTSFAKSREKVKGVINGRVEFEESSGKWYYKNDRQQKFSIGATSEGVKKIAIMDRLFANGYLDRSSVLFIDELESALHPDAICDFLDMLCSVSKEMGIQIFISSHSYFVIKKLYLLSINNPHFISCISLSKDSGPVICDLSGGMPPNSIIDASVKLYMQELDEVL